MRVEHPQPLLCRLCAVGECDGSMREVPSWCVHAQPLGECGGQLEGTVPGFQSGRVHGLPRPAPPRCRPSGAPAPARARTYSVKCVKLRADSCCKTPAINPCWSRNSFALYTYHMRKRHAGTCFLTHAETGGRFYITLMYSDGKLRIVRLGFGTS